MSELTIMDDKRAGRGVADAIFGLATFYNHKIFITPISTRGTLLAILYPDNPKFLC